MINPQNKNQTQQSSYIGSAIFISEEITHSAIQHIAYTLYESSGRRPGNELSDWLTAEKLFRQALPYTPIFWERTNDESM